ncbi:putative transmembrane reductase CYB561D1 isoform X2 [Hippocampus comes]|uniref:ascorbate ferrireductase (transmembrane) n=1 Tax=Hippocampus comes TaxID=109280 RepID=A0A3Q2YLT5_HIPCM|nr:PREDICTED: cytochrome b561 domain-containing protein 1 isoform X2 [Hippocampus comes]
MRSDVEYSPVGEGLGMRDFWLYAWMRRAAVIAAHVTGVSLTIIIAVLSRPGTSLFSWHPLCMALAYCLCMTEGILIFSPELSLFCFKSRKWKVRLHWFCQTLALIVAATGLGFIVASKNLSESRHLATWHSRLGICTLAASALQAACGVCVIYPKLLCLSTPPPRLKLYHGTCGLVVYLLATLTIMAAMLSDWYQAMVKGPVWWAIFLLPVFPALVVMNQITNGYLPRKKISS